jgi:hypothetical protein
MALFAVQGCTVNEVITAEESELVVADETVDESLLLDIGIVEFEDGVPENNDSADTRVYEEIRGAEARYLPYHLKTTLQGTGHWGAVRVIPSREAFTDVIISGRIEKSDGEYVKLEISVDDASGRHWYSEKYSAQTGVSSYSERRDRREDPYQKVFNDIANDLQAFVAGMPPQEVKRVRQVSELQFFGDMSPAQFGEHLATDEDDIVQVMRLPAENDPAVARLRQIRERDRLVVDTLNEHYANFYYGIAIPYSAWRKTSREEAINYRQVKRSATLQTLQFVDAPHAAKPAEHRHLAGHRPDICGLFTAFRGNASRRSDQGTVGVVRLGGCAHGDRRRGPDAPPYRDGCSPV